MTLDTDKFSVPDGPPIAGVQPMKSTSFGEVLGKLTNGVITYPNSDSGESSVFTTDGAGNITLQPQITTDDIPYNFNTGITAPPADGDIRFNNATLASATKIFMSDENASAKDIQDLLDDTLKIGQELLFTRANNQGQFIKFLVTGFIDAGDYHDIDVAFISQGGVDFAGTDLIVTTILSATSQNAVTSSFQSAANATQQTPPGATDSVIVWNNATQNVSTKLFINHKGLDNFDYSQLLESINLIDSTLFIVQVGDPDHFQSWNIDVIVAQTGYTELDVTLNNDNGGDFVDGDPLVLALVLAREVFHDATLTGKGTKGDVLSVVPGGATPSRIVAFVEDAATITVVAASGYHDINVTLVSAGSAVDFSVINNNEIQYDGTPTKTFFATLNFSGEKDGGGGGQQCDFSLFKNGTTKLNAKQSQIMLSGQRSNVSTHQVVTLAQNDTVIARLNNQTGNNDIQNDDLTVTLQEF